MKKIEIALIQTYVSNLQKQIITLSVLYKGMGEYIKVHIDDDIKEVISNEGSHFISESDNLHNITFLSDYFGYANISIDILSNYIIVATFSFYEKALKGILGRCSISPKKVNSCYKVEALIKILKDKFSIDYNNLSCSNNVEELRLLNNCLKHSSIIDNSLSKANNKWANGELIGNTYQDFERLNKAPINLLQDLITKIIEHRNSL